MRIFIAAIILIFSLQSLTKADDIRDFEIEGMSIGDSALDYFTEEQILNNRMSYYKNKSYTPVQIERLSFFETFESIAFGFKTGDKNYKILGLTGHIDYPNKISDCYKKQDEILEELSELFNNVALKSEKKTYINTIDEANDTKKVSQAFWFDSEDVVVVACYDYSLKSGYIDNLAVSIDTKEYNDFLGIAYK